MNIQVLKSHIILNTGYGEHAYNFTIAIANHGLEVLVVDDTPGKIHNLNIPGIRVIPEMYRSIPVIYICFHHNLYAIPDKQLAVIYTMMETDRLHPKWAEKVNKADSVWVPSRFNIDTFLDSGIHREKLSLVRAPIQVDTIEGKPFPFQTRKSFKFLSIFNRVIWYRKGVDVLMKAYLNAFTSEDDVCLILKTDMTREELLRIAGISDNPKLPEIEIIRTFLDENGMLSLYRGVNAYILPARGEGIGRPYLYAMSHELPVIATNWSGNTEFMNHDNSYLVNYELKDIPNEFEKIIYPLNFGAKYAEPDIDDLIRIMKYVPENSEENLRKGKRAKKEILTNHTYGAVAGQVINALRKLKPTATSSQRRLKPRDVFINMYPLYFPGKSTEEVKNLDIEFSKRPVKKIAIYGTGEGAKLAYQWLTRFDQIEKIVFIDRNKEKTRFMKRSVIHYEELKTNDADLILIGAAAVFISPILENLKKTTQVPVYFFGA